MSTSGAWLRKNLVLQTFHRRVALNASATGIWVFIPVAIVRCRLRVMGSFLSGAGGGGPGAVPDDRWVAQRQRASGLAEPTDVTGSLTSTTPSPQVPATGGASKPALSTRRVNSVCWRQRDTVHSRGSHLPRGGGDSFSGNPPVKPQT
jgi:hypothetical protein